jgi:hypothetical protein
MQLPEAILGLGGIEMEWGDICGSDRAFRSYQDCSRISEKTGENFWKQAFEASKHILLEDQGDCLSLPSLRGMSHGEEHLNTFRISIWPLASGHQEHTSLATNRVLSWSCHAIGLMEVGHRQCQNLEWEGDNSLCGA